MPHSSSATLTGHYPVQSAVRMSSHLSLHVKITGDTNANIIPTPNLHHTNGTFWTAIFNPIPHNARFRNVHSRYNVLSRNKSNTQLLIKCSQPWSIDLRIYLSHPLLSSSSSESRKHCVTYSNPANDCFYYTVSPSCGVLRKDASSPRSPIISTLSSSSLCIEASRRTP